MADDDVYYYICERLKLEGETENMGVCTKERKGVTAEVLRATPCTNSLGVCITKTEKAESEAQRGKPKGTLESESRNAIL